MIDNPGNFCWFGQTLIILKVAIDKQSFLAKKAADGDDFPSPFHETLHHILELAATHVLDPKPILKDFLNYFVEEDHGIVFEDSMEVRIQKRQAAKDRLEARKRNYMTQQQEGETGLDMMRNCPYFESIQISTRQVIRRQNCRPGCRDLDDPDDPLKYDIPLSYSQPQSMVVFPIPMPRRGHSVESTFLYSFDQVTPHNKRCRNCNGIKGQTTQMQLHNAPYSIIIGLNRGVLNHNGVTVDKDYSQVSVEKQFVLELPDGTRQNYKLVAASQHTGK